MSPNESLLSLDEDWCPCRNDRRLSGEDAPIWETVYVSVILFFMLIALISDKVGADSVMLTALALFMVAEIITVSEALRGFSNTGVLSVMILFVVAEGIARTGALDWYLGRLLGNPKTAPSAQLRLMGPVALLSAFMNNTPIVTVMIPIVQRWAHNIGINQRQLLIPLSFASIFGGTCTLIGTSTNLVVEGLLTERYKGQYTIGLFDLGEYGVPIAFLGIAYTILTSSYLLPDANSAISAEDDTAGILLGARLLSWSPAVGRTVRRSGLRDTGGIYLVSVRRAATGNIHRAVSSDFVLNAGDVLYFTGLIENFGSFCDEHGLEIVTNEVEELSSANSISEVGFTEASLMNADDDERRRQIVLLTDLIHGKLSGSDNSYQRLGPDHPARIIVTTDQNLVVLGVDAVDRPELLMDISKGLVGLNLHLRHTESSVIEGRSISVWRSESGSEARPDVHEIWLVLQALLSNEVGVGAIKKRGQRVIRAVVTEASRLVGKSALDVDFRSTYKSAIVAVQRQGRSITESLSSIVFRVGDAIILQVSEDSPLLVPPPADFHKSVKKSDDSQDDDIEASDSSSSRIQDVWRDLKVLVEKSQQEKEFLAVFEISKGSSLAGKTIFQSGISKLPDVFLISIERAVTKVDNRTVAVHAVADSTARVPVDDQWSVRSEHQAYESITPENPLEEGDLLWFAGTASQLGDLRKIPGLKSHENREVKKLNENAFDRRLVQAVISRHSPLVGKTVKEIRFRTRYGAAVIAINREGRRIYEQPGNIKLHSGDVLLLEAGTAFFANAVENNNSFALLSEVDNSAPPRMKMLIPALIIAVAMILLFTTETRPLITVAMLASALMVGIGILSEQEARDSVNWEVFVIVASAFGIGTALVNSGVAGGVADILVDIGVGIGIGDAGVLGAVYFATFLISNIVTNNAAAALLFPIAMDAADQSNIDRIIMSFAVMLGASASFLSPYGYTTNLLVYGPGGYKVVDFIKFGTPLHIVLWVASTVFLAVIEKWWISWMLSGGLLVLAIIYQFGSELIFKKKPAVDDIEDVKKPVSS